MSSVVKSYRIKRPKQYDSLMNLLKDKDSGVFDTLKGVLVFCASIGYWQGRREAVKESSEPIPFTYLSERTEQPFIYALALAEFDDVAYLREENFFESVRVFEEYAAGGLAYLDEVLDKDHVKQSIEVLISEVDADGSDLIDDLASQWD